MATAADTASCNNPTLTQYLAERGLLAYGQDADSDLTDRNSDRVRILRFLSQHPSGVKQVPLCHYVLKGTRPDNFVGFHDLTAADRWLPENERSETDRVWNGTGWTALDGTDPDYQFLNRFLNELEENTDLIRLDALAGENRHVLVTPTHRLLDLISEGTRETPSESSDLVYDRQYLKNILKASRNTHFDLTESQKEFAAASLRRYIRRVQDYRLCFDVHLANRSGYDRRRMEKPYATRFTDTGRQSKAFARLQAALETGYENAQNAVFTTLTTDPSKHESLYHAIQAINPNFHRLRNYFGSDPSTKRDTRKTDVSAWAEPLDGAVTGRPRESLDYIKVLEFDGGGKPHMHVMFFDVPCRESDGMPWLIDKAELSYRWDKYGQGRIVDLHPLVYRDDLDDLGNFGEQVKHDASGEPLRDDDGNPVTEPISEGFVSWYRYGNHDHSQEWIEDRVQYHKSNEGLIDMDGHEDNPQQKTAGAYLGKYVTEMYGLLLDHADGDLDHDHALTEADDDAEFWKLALYWATERQFWSVSQGIRDEIRPDGDRSDIRKGVAEATRTSLLHNAERCHEPHAQYPDFDRDRARSLLHRVTKDALQMLELDAPDAGTAATTIARVEYLGTYHYDDLPRNHTNRIRHENLEAATHDPDEPVVLASAGDRPPPIEQLY